MAFDRENAEYKVYENDLLPFVLRDTVKDTTNLPDAEKYKVAIKNSEQLTKFFTERSLSINRENAKFILNELGIYEARDQLPSQLSGGMARRASMARALSTDADVYILVDEDTKATFTGKRTLLEKYNVNIVGVRNIYETMQYLKLR